MPLPEKTLPFGLRDVKLTPFNSAGALDAANAADLPAARVFSFKETEDFESLTGDDVVQGSHGKGPVVEWELEAGGISFKAWKILAGGTNTSSGTTPNQINTFVKKDTDARPYFQVEGQAISDTGGDFHCVVFKCKADGDLKGGLEGGSFMLSNASGKGYGDATGQVYKFIQNETATAIT